MSFIGKCARQLLSDKSVIHSASNECEYSFPYNGITQLAECKGMAHLSIQGRYRFPFLSITFGHKSFVMSLYVRREQDKKAIQA